MPTPLEDPQLLSASAALSECLGIEIPSTLTEHEVAELFSGGAPRHWLYSGDNHSDEHGILHGGIIYSSHNYAGYQFGYFSGQLGDGRAMSLGEVYVGDERYRASESAQWPSTFEVQLKGAGITPFSRQADGRAVLRSSIREYLASEAMYALGVPTTRAATLVASPSTKALRDKLYDGNAAHEICAIVSRVAPSFLRCGSLEVTRPHDEMTGRCGPSHPLTDEQKRAQVRSLLQFVAERYMVTTDKAHDAATLYAALRAAPTGLFNEPLRVAPSPGFDADSLEHLVRVYREVVARTAMTVASWQALGFCHGVLNTDNLSLLGLTLDYGPFGFMEAFDRFHVCNHSDDSGRYCFDAQPTVCHWVMTQLATSMAVASSSTGVRDALVAVLDETYWSVYERHLCHLLRAKLGVRDDGEAADDDEVRVYLMLYEAMDLTHSDMTNTFVALADSSERRLERLLECSASADAYVGHFAPQMCDHTFHQLLLAVQADPRVLMHFGKSPTYVTDELTRRQHHEALTGGSKEAPVAVVSTASLLGLGDEISLPLPLSLSRVPPAAAPLLHESEPGTRCTSHLPKSLYLFTELPLTAAIKRERDERVWREWLRHFDALCERRGRVGVTRSPAVVLRNWVCEEVIKEQEALGGRKGGVMLHELVKAIGEPYGEGDGGEYRQRIRRPPPESMRDLVVSCSS